MLLPGSLFCIACGTSVRSTSHQARQISAPRREGVRHERSDPRPNQPRRRPRRRRLPRPGAAAPPPGVTAGTGGPPPGGGPFKSGKQKTIAMIVAGVIVVGGIGGLIGAMASGGGDDDKNVAAPGEGGSGILNPTPIGNTEPTPSETTEPTPQETTVPSPPPPGDGVTLGGGIATIPVPGGWSVLGQGDIDVLLGDDNGSWVCAIVGQEDPSTDAGALLSQIVTDILPAENYSQLEPVRCRRSSRSGRWSRLLSSTTRLCGSTPRDRCRSTASCSWASGRTVPRSSCQPNATRRRTLRKQSYDYLGTGGRRRLQRLRIELAEASSFRVRPLTVQTTR